MCSECQRLKLSTLPTHGLLEYGNSQDSGVRDFPGAIALAPSSIDDGLLTSTEILNMDLQAELVVLLHPIVSLLYMSYLTVQPVGRVSCVNLRYGRWDQYKCLFNRQRDSA
jgi:hypothetical protein